MKKVISVALMILFLVTSFVFAAQKTKIAVAANDKISVAEVSKQGLLPFSFFLTIKEK